MWKTLKYLSVLVVVDFFYFSSNLNFIRGLNTKMLLAVLGLAAFFFSFKRKGVSLPKQFFGLLFISIAISLMAFFSTLYNNTQESAYVTYFMSMLVWLFAAFFVVKYVSAVHGAMSLRLLARYVVIISAFQATIAVLGNMFAPVDAFIHFFTPGTQWLDSVDRLYGIGESTALDTGGIRYAIACILAIYLAFDDETGEPVKWAPLCFLSFADLTIAGNMVARTTLVGSIIGLVYFLIKAASFQTTMSYARIKMWTWLLSIIALVVVAMSYLYNTNEVMHENLRFGFEGFFSLVETGQWSVASNDKLMDMYIWPDNFKTWMIGDGYFNNPAWDPNFLGKFTEGWYMNTDVGYLRFIYMFGVVGLALFIVLILYCGNVCLKFYRDSWLLILGVLAMNFAVWFKVSTDCFFIFALLMCVAYYHVYMENPTPETQL